MKPGRKNLDATLVWPQNSMTASMNGINQRGTVSACMSRFRVSKSYSRLPFIRAVTSKPVATRNQPTPPIQPIKMWRGMKPTMYPNLNLPIR